MRHFFTFIRQDWAANRGNTKGRLLTLGFRIANYSSVYPAATYWLMPYLVMYKVIFEYVLGFELPRHVRVGSGLRVYHGQAVVVHKKVSMGINCTLRQSTTIGNNGKTASSPILGDHVDIGANVCLIGAITIGNHVIIGAGSVVTKNLPDYAVAVGNPARIIRITNPEAADLIPVL